MMPNYRIIVTRHIEQTHDLDLEADNEDEAREEAENEIENIAEDDWVDGFTSEDPEISKVVELADDGEEATDDEDEAVA